MVFLIWVIELLLLDQYQLILDLKHNHKNVLNLTASELLTSPNIDCYGGASNILAILFSFGLLAPWASIRMTRYRLNNVALITIDDFDTFVAGEQNRVSSAGEEISEFFDFDIGL